MNGQVFKGSNKPSNIVGNMTVSYYSLAPDESTEETNVFYLPTKGLNDHVYANIAFQKRIDDQLELIEIEIGYKRIKKRYVIRDIVNVFVGKEI